MHGWRWLWRIIRCLFYLGMLALIVWGERSSLPAVQGAIAGFLIADIVTDIVFSLLTLPTLDGREALETMVRLGVVLAALHFWGVGVSDDMEFVPVAFLVCLLTGGVKITGFGLRLVSGWEGENNG